MDEFLLVLLALIVILSCLVGLYLCALRSLSSTTATARAEPLQPMASTPPF